MLSGTVNVQMSIDRFDLALLMVDAFSILIFNLNAKYIAIQVYIDYNSQSGVSMFSAAKNIKRIIDLISITMIKNTRLCTFQGRVFFSKKKNRIFPQ